MANQVLPDSWPLEGLLSWPGTADRKGGHRTQGRHRRSRRAGESLPPLAGLIGGWIALLNVYPMLYPWHSPADKLIGIAVCALLSALGARVLQLASGDRLDPGLVVLGVALLLLIAVAAIITEGSLPAAAADLPREYLAGGPRP